PLFEVPFNQREELRRLRGLRCPQGEMWLLHSVAPRPPFQIRPEPDTTELEGPERRIETTEPLVDLGFGDDERGQQPNDGFRRSIHNHASRECGRYDRRRVTRQ